MSKSNYRKCVALGVTGKDTPTCFPAAIDKLLPGHRIEADAYVEYGRFVCKVVKLPKRQRNPAYKTMYEFIAGQVDAEGLEFCRVRTPEEFKDVVRDSLKSGVPIVLDLEVDKEESHAVGLEVYDRRRGQFTLTSTHIPYPLRGVVTLDYVFPFLHQSVDPPRIIYPFNDANITFIPAG